MSKKKKSSGPEKPTRMTVDDEVFDGEVIDVGAKKSELAPVSTGTVTTSDPLLVYLNEIRRYPLLTAEEEKALAIKYVETKDPEAAHKLITSNLRFVVKVAAEYSKFGARMIDLIQEGNVGLMHAVREFNPYKGVKLITYAVWWIRGYIREYLLRQYSVVRLGTSHNQKKLFYNVQSEEKKMEALGKELDVKELSERLGVTEDDVRAMQSRLVKRDVSLDQEVNDDSKITLLEQQADRELKNIDDQLSDDEEQKILYEKIESIRHSLNDKELMILERRLLADEPETLQEIGDKLKITRERARQLEARILTKLREAYNLDDTVIDADKG